MPWAAVAGAAAGYVLSSTDPLGGNDSKSSSGGSGGGKSIFDQSPETITATIAALSNAQNANPTDAEKQQLDALKRNNEIASAMWQRYQQVYQPLQDKVIEDANTMDSQGNLDREAGVANATVANQFEQARNASLERLRSMGVNPNSGAFMEANSRLSGQEAAANAGAQNSARQNLINTARQMRSGVAGQGTSIPGTSMSGLTSGASGLGSAASGIRSGRTSDNRSMGAYLNPLVGGVRDWIKGSSSGSSGSSNPYGFGSPVDDFVAGSEYGDTSGYYDEGQDWTMGNDTGGFAFANGGVVRGPGYADGGAVRGPGTGRSDSIAVAVKGRGGVARGYLSDGEFVVPSDVVRAKGVEFFNKLIETYHTPVARRGVRR